MGLRGAQRNIQENILYCTICRIYVYSISQLNLCDCVSTVKSVITRALLDCIPVELSNVINKFFEFAFDSYADCTSGFIKINIKFIDCKLQ